MLRTLNIKPVGYIDIGGCDKFYNWLKKWAWTYLKKNIDAYLERNILKQLIKY
jgi:hypothetical protein